MEGWERIVEKQILILAPPEGLVPTDPRTPQDNPVHFFHTRTSRPGTRDVQPPPKYQKLISRTHSLHDQRASHSLVTASYHPPKGAGGSDSFYFFPKLQDQQFLIIPFYSHYSSKANGSRFLILVIAQTLAGIKQVRNTMSWFQILRSKTQNRVHISLITKIHLELISSSSSRQQNTTFTKKSTKPMSVFNPEVLYSTNQLSCNCQEGIDNQLWDESNSQMRREKIDCKQNANQ